jgi:hypothetical protein
MPGRAYFSSIAHSPAALSSIAHPLASESGAARMSLAVQRLPAHALWATAAVACVAAAIVCGRTDVGTQRAMNFVSSLSLPSLLLPNQTAQHPFDAEAAVRQLAQAIRGLGADRDRLVAQIVSIEHTMDDMTGSITRQIETAKQANAKNTPPWPDSAPPVPMTMADVAAMVTPVAHPQAEDTPASTPPSASPTHGADIGGGVSVKALRARWTALYTAHPQMFDDLHPVVRLRDNPRTKRTELRLVIGPFADTEGVAQLCAAILPLRLSCQMTTFDGRHLALD